jgi:hypothetical protein|tara:strand:- start:9970 stop:10167 length:198 start_codon:yes stop_codon:yes gene_type:complete
MVGIMLNFFEVLDKEYKTRATINILPHFKIKPHSSYNQKFYEIEGFWCYGVFKNRKDNYQQLTLL